MNLTKFLTEIFIHNWSDYSIRNSDGQNYTGTLVEWINDNSDYYLRITNLKQDIVLSRQFIFSIDNEYTPYYKSLKDFVNTVLERNRIRKIDTFLI